MFECDDMIRMMEYRDMYLDFSIFFCTYVYSVLLLIGYIYKMYTSHGGPFTILCKRIYIFFPAEKKD